MRAGSALGSRAYGSAFARARADRADVLAHPPAAGECFSRAGREPPDPARDAPARGGRRSAEASGSPANRIKWSLRAGDRLLHRRKSDWTYVSFAGSRERLCWSARATGKCAERECHAIDAPRSDCRLRGGLAGGAVGLCPGRLSQPNRPNDRALSGGWHHRFSRPAGCRSASAAASGATVEIENKPGAATAVGAEHVARSEPDGHTLLMATSTTLAINKTLYRKLPYDPVKDFTPIALVAGVSVRADRQPADPGEDAVRLHRLRQVEAGTDLWFGRQRQPAASRRRDAEGSGRDQYPPCPVSQQRVGDARRDRGTPCLHDGGSAACAEADP